MWTAQNSPQWMVGGANRGRELEAGPQARALAAFFAISEKPFALASFSMLSRRARAAVVWPDFISISASARRASKPYPTKP